MKVENIRVKDLQTRISALDRKLEKYAVNQMNISQCMIEINRARAIENEAWEESALRRLQDLKAQRASLRGLSKERLQLINQLNAQTDPKSRYYVGLQPANFQEVQS